MDAPAPAESSTCRELPVPRRNEVILFELSLLPWWVSAAIAAVAFVGVVYVFPSMSLESPLWAFVVPLQTKAPYFGIAVAAVFLLPAVVSYVERARKKRLLDRQQDLECIRNLPWRQFEELVAEAFRRDRFRVIENTSAGPDGGVDIRLRKGGESYLVQCKNWRKRSIGVATVREMFGVLVAESAREVLVVGSGTFTAEAARFAKGKSIRLVDGNALMKMIARVRRDKSNGLQATLVTGGQRERVDDDVRGHEPDGLKSMHSSPPSCPRCGGNLVVRTAGRGRRRSR